jgi:hypothetical protein
MLQCGSKTFDFHCLLFVTVLPYFADKYPFYEVVCFLWFSEPLRMWQLPYKVVLIAPPGLDHLPTAEPLLGYILCTWEIGLRGV